MSSDPDSNRPLATLRRFVKPRTMVAERCDLCAAPLAPVHSHVLERPNRQLRCACAACAILFSNHADAKLVRVPPRAELLPDFKLTDAQWAGLNIPIGLAFLMRSTGAGRVVAVYPSPGGATEAVLDADAWEELATENPVLRELEPDIEALLVNRLKETREHYRASIDHCYQLVGLIRKHWRGLSGGQEVWQAVGEFFDRLRKG